MAAQVEKIKSTETVYTSVLVLVLLGEYVKRASGEKKNSKYRIKNTTRFLYPDFSTFESLYGRRRKAESLYRLFQRMLLQFGTILPDPVQAGSRLDGSNVERSTAWY